MSVIRPKVKDDLSQLQQDDPSISSVKGWVEEGKKPTFKDKSQERYFIKSLWNQYETLEVENGLLVTIWQGGPTKKERNTVYHALAA